MKNLFRSVSFWVVLLLMIIISGFVLLRLDQLEQTKQVDTVKRSPLRVKTATVKKGEIRQWIFGKGIVRAAQREFLNFEHPGKVVFINKDTDGQNLREGSRVRGPLPGEKFGQLLARLDKREHTAVLQTHEASLAQARQDEAAAKLAVDQANNELSHYKKILKRTEKLYQDKLISQSELEIVQANYLNAQNTLKTTATQLKGTEARIKGAIAQLNHAKLGLERTSLFAPFNGVVAYFNIKMGDYVNPATVDQSSEDSLLRTSSIVIIATDLFEITLDLPVYDGKLVKRGQTAFITWGDQSLAYDPEPTEAKEDTPFAVGEVYAVNPTISLSKRTIQVKIRTKDGDQLQDGMFVTCWIVTEEKKDTLLIPLNSLVYRDNQPYVFVVDSTHNTVTKQKVKTGIEDVPFLEVIDGVKENDIVVTEGRHRLAEGTQISILQDSSAVHKNSTQDSANK